nr:hypothetical protein [uncultured Campylobacter sp.]
MNTADNQAQNLISNPQNSNFANLGSGKFARDYDKEPIIIKDYKQNLSLFLALLTLALVAIIILISLFFSLMSLDRILFSSIITIIVLKPTLKEALSAPKNGHFIFKNGAVKQQITDKTIKEIKLVQIADLRKTFDITDDLYQIEANKNIVFIGLVFVLLALKNYCDVMGVNIFEICAFFIFLFFIGLTPQTIFHFRLGGLKSCAVYNMLAIFSKKDGVIINILIPTNNDYKELKEYFLRKKGINLDNVSKQFKLIKFK